MAIRCAFGPAVPDVAVLLLVGVLTSLAAAAPEPATQPAEWQTYELAKKGAAKVWLEAKRRATPADREFLRLVFHNGGGAAIRVTNAHYRIERETFDAASVQSDQNPLQLSNGHSSA